MGEESPNGERIKAELRAVRNAVMLGIGSHQGKGKKSEVKNTETQNETNRCKTFNNGRSF